MTTVVNNAASTLRSAYAAGDGVLHMKSGDGGKFGSQFPIRATVQSPNGGAQTIYMVTGRTVDDLLVSGATEGTLDQAHPTGSAVENRWTAGAVAELAPLASANTFTAPQVVMAHAALGANAAIDPPSLSGTLWTPQVVLAIAEVSTAAPAGGVCPAGILSSLTANPSAVATNNRYVGICDEVFVQAGNVNALGSVYGVAVAMKHSGSGATGRLVGYDASVINASTATVTDLVGLSVWAQNSGTGTATNCYGVRVFAPSNTGTMNLCYGVYVRDHSSVPGVTGYNVFSEGANSRNAFEGIVRVGPATAAPSAVLDVQSTVKGMLPPRMTTVQRNAIAAPAEGLIVYDSTLHALCFRRAADWLVIGGAPGLLEVDSTPPPEAEGEPLEAEEVREAPPPEVSEGPPAEAEIGPSEPQPEAEGTVPPPLELDIAEEAPPEETQRHGKRQRKPRGPSR